MKKTLLTFSLLLNLFFLVFITYRVYQKGGVKFIKEKIGLEQLPAHNPHYFERKSLFEILPKDSSSIIFLGNSITEGCEWSELFSNPKIKNRGIGVMIHKVFLKESIVLHHACQEKCLL